MAWLVNEGWLRRVWYLKSVTSNSTILFMKLAASLKPLVFTPGEFCPQGFLYFIKRGQVLWASKVLGEGDIWGDDVVLDNPGLQLDFPALAITYAACASHATHDALLRTLHPLCTHPPSHGTHSPLATGTRGFSSSRARRSSRQSPSSPPKYAHPPRFLCPLLSVPYPCTQRAFVLIASSPHSPLPLAQADFVKRVRSKWIVRRAIVRYAERDMHARGLEFRGRSRPIYAKEITEALNQRNLHEDIKKLRSETPPPSRRRTLQRRAVNEAPPPTQPTMGQGTATQGTATQLTTAGETAGGDSGDKRGRAESGIDGKAGHSRSEGTTPKRLNLRRRAARLSGEKEKEKPRQEFKVYGYASEVRKNQMIAGNTAGASSSGMAGTSDEGRLQRMEERFERLESKFDMLLQRLPQSDAEQEARHGVVPVAANQGGVLGWLTPKGAAPAPAPAPAHANHAAFKKQGPLQA